MIHDISGTHPQMTNDQSAPQSLGGREAPTGHEQELTPDRPPPSAVSAEAKPRRPRGFGAMDRQLVTEIARKGGKAAHSAGTAHEFTSEEAREAGRTGGRATHAKRRQVAEGAGAAKEPAKG